MFEFAHGSFEIALREELLTGSVMGGRLLAGKRTWCQPSDGRFYFRASGCLWIRCKIGPVVLYSLGSSAEFVEAQRNVVKVQRSVLEPLCFPELAESVLVLSFGEELLSCTVPSDRVVA